MASSVWKDYANQAISLAQQLGMQTLSSVYPYDFEWYMCALELTDSKDQTIDYLAFPIQPDSIQKSEPTRNNIKKSMAGVTVLSNDAYIPQDITIRGSFGRQFKLLLNVKEIKGKNSQYSTVNGVYSLYQKAGASAINYPSFNIAAKNGYGIIKILQAIVNKSVGLDDEGKPFKLYFYNMALGESYLVAIPPSGAQFSQDVSKNMVWSYSITMKTLAPLDAVREEQEGSLRKELSATAVAAGVSMVAQGVNDIMMEIGKSNNGTLDARSIGSYVIDSWAGGVV